MDLGGEDRRHPKAHRLAEDVAQGERLQDAQGMRDQPLPAHIRLRALLDRLDAGQDVAVGEYHALGLAGGAGGEEDFERRGARESVDGASLYSGQNAEPIFEGEARILSGQLIEQQGIADGQFGLHIGGDAPGKLRASVSVQRDGEDATQQAAVKGGDPLSAVLRPEQNPVAGADAALGQQRGKAPGKLRQLGVGG